MSSGQAVLTHSHGFVQVQAFFEPDTEGDVLYCSTFVLGVYNFGAQCVDRFVVHIDVVRLVDLSKLFFTFMRFMARVNKT